MPIVLIRPETAKEETFVVEVAKTFEVSGDNSITAHPVESGSNIADHVFSNNKVVTIEGINSDASFLGFSLGGVSLTKVSDAIFKPDEGVETGNNLLTNGKQSALEARASLEEMRDDREVVTLVSTRGEIENLVIKSVSFKDDANNSTRTLHYSLTLEQIQISQQSATTTQGVEVDPEVEDDMAKEKDKGKEPGVDTDASAAFSAVQSAFSGVQSILESIADTPK